MFQIPCLDSYTPHSVQDVSVKSPLETKFDRTSFEGGNNSTSYKIPMVVSLGIK